MSLSYSLSNFPLGQLLSVFPYEAFKHVSEDSRRLQLHVADMTYTVPAAEHVGDNDLRTHHLAVGRITGLVPPNSNGSMVLTPTFKWDDFEINLEVILHTRWAAKSGEVMIYHDPIKIERIYENVGGKSQYIGAHRGRGAAITEYMKTHLHIQDLTLTLSRFDGELVENKPEEQVREEA